MAELLGADVEALEQIFKRLSNASQTADSARGSLQNMAADLRFYGRYGDEFTDFVAGQAAPALGLVAENLSSLGEEIMAHVREQRQLSDGEGMTGAQMAVAAGAVAGAGVLAAAAQGRGAGRQRQQQPAVQQLGRRENGQRVVDYPNGERRIGGDRAWRNNNPGNLVWNNGDTFARDNGAIGRDYQDANGNWMAVFPDQATGERAQEALLRNRYGDNTIAEMVQRYAPPHENDTEQYIRIITERANVERNAVVGNLTDGQFRAVVDAMRQHEGQRAGRIERQWSQDR